MSKINDYFELSGKNIILGLTGGIACYKAAELTRILVKNGVNVHIVMTKNATHFITPLTMQVLSGNPVNTDNWYKSDSNSMLHINLSRRANAIIIVPASANFIAKLAFGIADDLLSTLCLARNCPLLVVPAMNQEMWNKPTTTRNINQILSDGIEICGPTYGIQACDEVGDGRMLEAKQIFDALYAMLTPKLLNNYNIVITAGPTFEPIDPIRGLTNRSSGKMGFELAHAAANVGAIVHLVAGFVSLPTPWGVQYRYNVETANEMREKVFSLIPNSDIFISVAAVSDWRILHISIDKIKKINIKKPPELILIENPDILAEVALQNNAPYCVGFAAESCNLIKHIVSKRIRKRISLLIGNLVHQSFGYDDNEIVICDDKGYQQLPRTRKKILAQIIINEIVKRINANK